MKDPFSLNAGMTGKKTSKKLDWDESAADTQSKMENPHDQDRFVPGFFGTRFFLLCIFFILAARLGYLQIIKGQYFRDLSDNNRIRSQILEAPRGIIFDRQQKPLLENIAGYNLVAVPFDLLKNNYIAQAQNLAQVLGLEQQAVLDKLKKIDFKSIEPIVISQVPSGCIGKC
jgi:cell division protein FtsI/penicillin-binding protein 2